jgi:hypothetical protein
MHRVLALRINKHVSIELSLVDMRLLTSKVSHDSFCPLFNQRLGRVSSIPAKRITKNELMYAPSLSAKNEKLRFHRATIC